MNVQEIADRLAEKHDVSKADARAMIETLTNAIAEAARAGDEVSLPGFGKFKVRDREAREARNPQTGKTVQVPAQRKLAFLPAKALKDGMNGASAAGKAAPKASAGKSSAGKSSTGKSSGGEKPSGGKTAAKDSTVSRARASA